MSHSKVNLRSLLTQLYTEIYGDPNQRGKMKNLTELGRALATQVGRTEPYKPKYLANIMSGNAPLLERGSDIERAMYALAGRLDDAPPLQAHVTPIEVLVINGQVKPGSIVTGRSCPCQGCGVLIVPHHPRQRFCCSECRRKWHKDKRNRERKPETT